VSKGKAVWTSDSSKGVVCADVRRWRANQGEKK
jgi:hypothetical protein